MGLKKASDLGVVVRALLRPLVKFCLGRGIRFKECESLLREVFVEQARIQIKRAGGEPSASRISVATGIHRTEVARLAAGDEKSSDRHDLLNRVVGMWMQGKRFRFPDGRPRPLTFEGTKSEFAKLSAAVSRELSPYPLLFELERLGAIAYEGDRVRLTVAEYVPKGDVDHAFGVVADDVLDLVHAAEANVVGAHATPNLHLRTYYDNITAGSIPEIRIWLLRRGAKFHEEAREFLSRFDRDLNPEAPGGDGGCRVAVTTFGIAEPPEAVPTIKPKKRGRRKSNE